MTLSHTEQEMFDAADVCRNFDFALTRELAHRIDTSRVIFTGMGSSLIFPGKQAKNRALKYNLGNKVEVYFASDLFQYADFADTYVFLCSNSGETKEVILLLEHLKAHGAICIAVTAVADSTLARRADEKIILTCGFEQGVAATKSVVEQGLIYDSLIFHLADNQGREVDFQNLKAALAETAEAITKNINVSLDENVIDTLLASDAYFFVGLDNGVAEEITLKAYEITRKMALFYPDTHIVHGVEEAIEGNCAMVFEPAAFKDYISDFQKFGQTTGCSLVSVGVGTALSSIPIATSELFNNYCLLAAGWGVLRSISNNLGLDIDHPEKASKVGNPFIG